MIDYYEWLTKFKWEFKWGEGGEGLSCPFLKIKKKCPDFAKKGPDYVHP